MLQARVALASVVLLASAACSQDEPDSATPSSDPSTPTSSTPTASIAPELAGYSEKERAAYADAVADHEQFSLQQSAIYEQGRATPKARAFYRKYTASWQSYWARLRQYEGQGIRIVGRGRTLSTKPLKIELRNTGSGSVVFANCGVARGVKVFQNDTAVPQPDPTPTVTRVAMEKLPGENWWRVLYTRVGKPC